MMDSSECLIQSNQQITFEDAKDTCIKVVYQNTGYQCYMQRIDVEEASDTEEDKQSKDTMGLVPHNGYPSKDKQSVKAITWLQWLNVKNGFSG
uniref:Uncharacterized protein n=1 Tax=Romanomermis culicivorax TaxID=13658 RepID=A0A915L1U6_ROMCU